MINMNKVSDEERRTTVMKLALAYVLTTDSMRGIAAKFGIPKSTVQKWLSCLLPEIDPVLSKIVVRKANLYAKQKYIFVLNSNERRTVLSKSRAKYITA
jgi:hypothetical protein